MGITVDSNPEWRASILRVACDAPRCSFVQTFLGTGFLSNYLAALKTGWLKTASGDFSVANAKEQKRRGFSLIENVAQIAFQSRL